MKPHGGLLIAALLVLAMVAGCQKKDKAPVVRRSGPRGRTAGAEPPAMAQSETAPAETPAAAAAQSRPAVADAGGDRARPADSRPSPTTSPTTSPASLV